MGDKIRNLSKGQITENLQCQANVVTETPLKEFELSIISLDWALGQWALENCVESIRVGEN